MSKHNPTELEVLRAILGFVIIGHALYWGVKLAWIILR